MRVAVTGATGLIGSALLPQLVAAGHQVVRLVRREPRGPDEVRWDPMSGAASGVDLDRLVGVDAVIHLAGAGVGDRRWTGRYKRTIRDSRVLGTRTLVAALVALDTRPSVLVSGSAVGYYGSRGDEVLTESSAPGEGFLADVCVAWEGEARSAEEAGIRTVLARTGLVMTDRGGAFGRLLPILTLGLGGPLGSGRAWWPWITLEDEVRALVHCLSTESLSGPVNLGGPEPGRNRDVTRALARELRRPAVLPVPPVALRLAFGEFADDILSSQRMTPDALVESGFVFQHPNLATACRWLVAPGDPAPG
ncbi:MAG: TIGR01777 family oxidoreductase [Kineosporiaceae bacterium]